MTFVISLRPRQNNGKLTNYTFDVKDIAYIFYNGTYLNIYFKSTDNYISILDEAYDLSAVYNVHCKLQKAFEAYRE